MEIALGIDSRDVPMARYADPQEQLARLEEEKKKYFKIMAGGTFAKYGILLGSFFGCMCVSNPSALFPITTAGLGGAVIASFERDHAMQKFMALSVKKEQIKRAANPQGYIEQAIEDRKKEMSECQAEIERKLQSSSSDDKLGDIKQLRIKAEENRKKIELYTKAYEQAKKNGNIEELSHLVCECECYHKVMNTASNVVYSEPKMKLDEVAGVMTALGALGTFSYNTSLIAGGIFVAEVGVILAKKVARYVKFNQISKDGEKADKAIENFVNNNEKER